MSQIDTIKEHAQRLEARLKNIKEEGKGIVKRGTGVMVQAGGGATVALTRVFMPKLPVVDVDTDLAIGAGAAALGVFNILDGGADELAAYGGAILACVTARELETALIAARQKAQEGT